jgi:hypothetical protein
LLPWLPGKVGENIESHVESDFIPMKKLISHGKPHQNSELRAVRVYVWGIIRYKDLTPEWVKVPFCRYISAETIFDATEEGGTATNKDSSCEIPGYKP